MTSEVKQQPDERLVSLDFFRGATMFLLIAEGTHLFSFLVHPSLENTWLFAFGENFHHHPWNGLRFWDLIQPFFMFIVGVALPFSVAQRTKMGDTPRKIFRHVITRSALLLLLGWGLYCIGPGRITFRFQNVLAQLSVTYLIAYLLMNRRWTIQIIASLCLLALSESLYRFFPVEGFSQPFEPAKNFGAWVDMKISGELSGGHWVSFNAIPSAAHTIWGVIAGQLLMSDRSDKRKLLTLLGFGLAALLTGLALDPVTPIIKRICTSSFVLASGGWCLIALACSYWIIDMLKWRHGVWFFTIVGMNPLAIYLWTETGGGTFIYRIIKPFSMALFQWIGELNAQIITALITWFCLWAICWFLYRKRIFLRL